MPRFGTALPGAQQIPARTRPWERTVGGPEMLAAACDAERCGFAWVSCSDHVAVPASRAEEMGPTWYDAGSTLAFVAGATTRIGLLPHVLVLPYRHPLVVAKQYGTLDRLSGGRLILGVGTGHLKPEFRSLGADYERRGKVTDEYLQAIAAAWEHDVAHFAGATASFRDVMVWPRPAQQPRPPIWVGGNSRAALRRAVRLGDGWVPWELTAEACGEAVVLARQWRAEAGRTGPFEVVVPLAVAADTAADQLVAAAGGWLEAGATAFHVGLVAESFAAYRARLEWFAGRVMAQMP